MNACSSAPPPPSPPTIVHVQIAKVKPESISQVVTGSGTLYPISQADLSPKISAPVRQFYVERGDRVHRGQLLAVLENRDLAAAATAAEGAFDKAQANYQSVTATTIPEQLQNARMNLENAKANLAVQQKLYQSNLWLYQQKALARKQLDLSEVALTNAKTQYQTAEKALENLTTAGRLEQVNSAEGVLESARGQYLSAKAQLEYTELRSPISGVVADRSIFPGEVAQAGTPLITVMDVSKVIVRLHVPQSQVGKLKLGDSATIHLPGSTETVPAKITVLSPALDPNSTTVQIWVEADNSRHLLQPGATVDVSLIAETVPHALVVPANSLIKDSNGRSSVMVVDSQGRVHRHDVTTGIEQNGEVQILSGLEQGEEVVASGAYGLPDNTKVTAEQSASAK